MAMILKINDLSYTPLIYQDLTLREPSLLIIKDQGNIILAIVDQASLVC